MFKKQQRLFIILFLTLTIASIIFVSYVITFRERLFSPSKENLLIGSIKSPLKATETDHFNPSKPNRTILLWTTFFGANNFVRNLNEYGCKFKNCIFTSDRNMLRQSDALLFHLRDTDLKDLPKYRNPHQKWMLVHHESPPHTPRIILNGLNGLINWTISYRLDSDIVLSPRFRPRPTSVIKPAFIDYAANKTRLVAWFASNCNTPGKRELYVEELSKTITVDVFGDCGDKRCTPKMSPKCYIQAAKEYRFYLSFENSICKDYVTEKLFAAMRYDLVPIVLGGADYGLFAPQNSYINALNFPSPRELGEHLLEIAKSPKTYNSLFDWRREYEFFIDSYPCQICKKLNEDADGGVKDSKTWTDLSSWWFSDANCRKWTKHGLRFTGYFE